MTNTMLGISKIDNGSHDMRIREDERNDWNEYIVRQLRDYTARFIGRKLAYQNINVNLYLNDSNGRLFGGLIGHISFGILHIRYLWVHANYRGKGYGRQLMAKAEAVGRKHNCSHTRLETAPFHAPGFYQRMGYFNPLKENSKQELTYHVLIKKIWTP